MDAVVFVRDCGATTGFSTQLSILPSGRLPEGPGSALVLDQSVPLKLSWPSNKTLSVAGLGTARVFHQASQVGGIQVSYAE
jgi:hypothetical protein